MNSRRWLLSLLLPKRLETPLKISLPILTMLPRFSASEFGSSAAWRARSSMNSRRWLLLSLLPPKRLSTPLMMSPPTLTILPRFSASLSAGAAADDSSRLGLDLPESCWMICWRRWSLL